MIFEKDVRQAIVTLRDICFIIPPMPSLQDLSYRAEDTVFSKKAGTVYKDKKVNFSMNTSVSQQDRLQEMEDKVTRKLSQRELAINNLMNQIENDEMATKAKQVNLMRRSSNSVSQYAKQRPISSVSN